MVAALERLKSDDYSVGWYCPLAVPEMQASRVLFDKEHERITLRENPTFLYTYGEMNGALIASYGHTAVSRTVEQKPTP